MISVINFAWETLSMHLPRTFELPSGSNALPGNRVELYLD